MPLWVVLGLAWGYAMELLVLAPKRERERAYYEVRERAELPAPCTCERCQRMRGEKGWWDALPPEKRADLAIVDQVEGCSS